MPAVTPEVVVNTLPLVVVIVLAYVVYTAVTGVSLPGAAVMTLLLGWFFQRVYGQATGLAVGVVVVCTVGGFSRMLTGAVGTCLDGP